MTAPGSTAQSSSARRDQCRMVKRWCTVASTAHEMILGLNPGERTNGRGHGERRESGRPRSTYARVPGDATKGRVITDSSERRASHPQFDRYTRTVVRWNRVARVHSELLGDAE